MSSGNMRLPFNKLVRYVARGRFVSTNSYATRLEEASMASRLDPVVWGQNASPLSPQQVVEFEKQGFIVLRKAICANALKPALENLKHVMKGGIENGERVIVHEPGSLDRVRSIFAIHRGNDALGDLCRSAGIGSHVASQLLDDDVYIHQSRANIYSAGASGFSWHSDFESWHAEDGMPRPRCLTAMIMCDQNTPVNGALMVIPRSHKIYVRCAGQQPNNNWKTSVREIQKYGTPPMDLIEAMASNGDADEIQLVTGRPGDILLFDSNLLHASYGNFAWSPRCNLFVVFNAVSNALMKRPFHADEQRPEHFAHRQYVPVVQCKKDVTEQVQAKEFRFRSMEPSDANAVYELMLASGMDVNSQYCYFALAAHFKTTCIVATCERSGTLCGAVVGYRIPMHQDTFFCWQVAVYPDSRSRGLASKMLLDLVTNKLAGVRYIEATVCPSNVWSRELFIRLGRKLQNANVHWETNFVPSEAFQQDPGSRVHEQEDLVRIGPFGLREDEIGDEISFYVRDLDDVEAGGDYKRGALGKWESRRYVTRKHGLGFSFHHTIMYEGQPSFQWYPNHVESVYISEGEGTIELVGEGSPHHFEHLIGTGKLYKLKPGTIYVLRGERHILTATSPGGMHCMCVFNPPATGKEDHNEKTGAYPVIADDGVAYESYGSDLVPLIFKPPRAFADGSRGRLAEDRKV